MKVIVDKSAFRWFRKMTEEWEDSKFKQQCLDAMDWKKGFNKSFTIEVKSN